NGARIVSRLLTEITLESNRGSAPNFRCFRECRGTGCWAAGRSIDHAAKVADPVWNPSGARAGLPVFHPPARGVPVVRMDSGDTESDAASDEELSGGLVLRRRRGDAMRYNLQ